MGKPIFLLENFGGYVSTHYEINVITFVAEIMLPNFHINYKFHVLDKQCVNKTITKRTSIAQHNFGV